MALSCSKATAIGMAMSLSRSSLFASNRNLYASPFLSASSPFFRSFSSLPFYANTSPSLFPSPKIPYHNIPRFGFTSESNPDRKSIDTKLNFSLSNSDSDEEDDKLSNKTALKDKKLPPPYDPFNKKPAIEEPKDPKDLQQIFHDMRTGDGMLNHAVKMFDALSKDGLTHEALELFGQIKDKGHMPDVVAHTAVIEAYANAAQPKEALKVYMRMLASGVSPNAYTYAVLVKGLAGETKFLGDAKKYVLEMMDKGMKPNAGTYTAVFEALAKEGKVDEAREFLEKMKAKGFVPDEKGVREALINQRGPVFRTVINVLFGK